MIRRPHRLFLHLSALFVPLVTSAPASANIWDPQPDTSIVRGNNVRRTSLSGASQTGSGDLTFGASYAFDAAVIATDHDLQCQTSDPYAMCGQWGYFAGACLPDATALHNSYCAHHGKRVSVGSAANASVKLFGKDLPLFNAWAHADSSTIEGSSSTWAFALGGYTLWTSPISGRYATPAISTTAISPAVVSIQGYLFSVSVGVFGQVTAEAELFASPGTLTATANVTPGGTLGGIVFAGPAAPGYTVGVNGTLELLSVQAPLKAAAGVRGNTLGYSLSRQVDYRGGAGSVSFGVFGPNLPPNLSIPVVSWPGISANGPLTTLNDSFTF